MKQKLLKLAELLEFKTYLNSHNHWIVQGYENQKIWRLEETSPDLWLLLFEEQPEMLVNTNTAISMLFKIS